jgi:hypothetical protein
MRAAYERVGRKTEKNFFENEAPARGGLCVCDAWDTQNVSVQPPALHNQQVEICSCPKKAFGVTGKLKRIKLLLVAFAISFCLPERSTQQVSSDYWLSSRSVEPVVFAYSSDLNRP